MNALQKYKAPISLDPMSGVRKLCRRVSARLFSVGPGDGARNATSRVFPKIKVFRQIIQAVCRRAFGHPEVEVGGHLYGGFDGHGTPVVVVETPPGPHCQCSPVAFSQDFAFFRATTEHLSKHLGLWLCGRWHSHRNLQLHRPSSDDETSAQSLMRKNSFPAFAEIILNLEPDGQRVAVSSSVYYPEAPFRARPARLELLPDVSPNRAALVGTVVYPDADTYAHDFPWEWIAIQNAFSGEDLDLPEAILRQIAELSAEVQPQVRVACRDGGISLELPLAGSARGFVAYTSTERLVPAAIFLRRRPGGELLDVTAAVNADSQSHLALIHSRLLRLTDPEVTAPPVSAPPRGGVQMDQGSTLARSRAQASIKENAKLHTASPPTTPKPTLSHAAPPVCKPPSKQTKKNRKSKQ